MTLFRLRLSQRVLCAAASAVGILAALPALAAPPPAAPSTDRIAIQAVYDQLGAAFGQHDLARFMSYFTPDYIDVDEKGAHLSKEQTRRGYQDQLGQIKTMQSHYAIQSLTPTAGGTLVEMKMHSDGTGAKRILFAKLHANFTDDLWVRDLWVNTPQGWRLQHRQTLQDQLRIHPR
ncbi:MAG: nuclear transport factor 2 family protein [Armatimonadota bacterium]|nr:nuclear transport factor 2 family protein [Armatimonadota bacterium]